MSFTGNIKSAIGSLVTPSLKTYNSFQEAQDTSGMGYEDKELVEVIVAKTLQNRHLLNDATHFNNATLSSLTSLLYCLQEFDSINVIDLGGGTGLQYHLIRGLINNKKRSIGML